MKKGPPTKAEWEGLVFTENQEKAPSRIHKEERKRPLPLLKILKRSGGVRARGEGGKGCMYNFPVVRGGGKKKKGSHTEQ